MGLRARGLNKGPQAGFLGRLRGLRFFSFTVVEQETTLPVRAALAIVYDLPKA